MHNSRKLQLEQLLLASCMVTVQADSFIVKVNLVWFVYFTFYARLDPDQSAIKAINSSSV